MGAVAETGGSGETAEGHSRKYFGSGKGAASTGFWQAWQKRGRVGGGDGHRRVGSRPGTLVCWEGDRCRPCVWIILCRDMKEIGGGGAGVGGGFPPWKDIIRREER